MSHGGYQQYGGNPYGGENPYGQSTGGGYGASNPYGGQVRFASPAQVCFAGAMAAEAPRATSIEPAS